MRQWATREKCKFVYLNIILTVEPRAVDPHCFDADPDPAQNLDADPDPDGGGGVGQPKMCIPPGKILGTPLSYGTFFHKIENYIIFEMLKKTIWASFQRIIELFTHKFVKLSKIWVWDPRSGIRKKTYSGSPIRNRNTATY
jgi:hypothetical protein